MWVGQFIPMFLAIYNGMSPGLSSILLQTQVILTTIWSVVFFKSRLNKLNILGLTISSLGLAWIVAQSGPGSMLVGYVLILIAAFSVSVGNMFLKTAPDENLLSMICWSIMLAIPPLLLTTYIIEGFDLIGSQIEQITLASAVSILFTSYISSPVGFVIWAWLMRLYSPAAVSPFTLLVPVFGMGSCALILKENFTIYNILASGLIILGLIVNYADRLRRVKKPPVNLLEENTLHKAA